MFIVLFTAVLALLWAAFFLTAFCPLRAARRRAERIEATRLESSCVEREGRFKQ